MQVYLRDCKRNKIRRNASIFKGHVSVIKSLAMRVYLKDWKRDKIPRNASMFKGLEA